MRFGVWLFLVLLLVAGGAGLAMLEATRLDVQGLATSFSEIELRRIQVAYDIRASLLRQQTLMAEAQVPAMTHASHRLAAQLANLEHLLEADVRSTRGSFGPHRRAFRSYIADARVFLDLLRADARGPQLGARYERLRADSRDLTLRASRVISENQRELRRILQSYAAAVARLERLVTGMMLGAVVAVALAGWGVYQGTIRPLLRRISETEASLQRQERLASLGTLTAGVAHEIRNPLTAIKARLFSIGRVLPAESPARPHVDVVGREVDRLERIVQGFLRFARPAEPHLQDILIPDLVSEVSDLLASEFKARRVQLTCETSGPSDLRADPEQLKQVLINLLRNAADATAAQGGGSVTLRAGAARHHPLRHVGAAVAIEVQDSGPGIPKEEQARLFDPFFTTKPDGTGLGLSIADRIVKNHGGLLTVHSEPGRGALFRIVLPRRLDPPSPAD